MTIHYAELTWVDIAEAIKDDAIAVLPLGCIEQHGPHLPLDCDAGLPTIAIERVNNEHGIQTLLLPLMPYGPAWEHMSFPRTISLTYETWLRVIKEIVASLFHHGFRRIVILRGCGGHFGVETAIYELWREERLKGKNAFIEVAPIVAGMPDIQEKVHRYFPDIKDVHAGEFETSLTLVERPHLVRQDRIPDGSHPATPQNGCWWARIEEFSENGATGNPQRASAEAGRELAQAMGYALIEWLVDFDQRTR